MTNQQRTNKATTTDDQPAEDQQGNNQQERRRLTRLRKNQNKLQKIIVVRSLKGLVVESPHTVLLFVPHQDKEGMMPPKDDLVWRWRGGVIPGRKKVSGKSFFQKSCGVDPARSEVV